MADLRDLPAVRAEAERLANEFHARLFGRATDGQRLDAWREAHLDLLCDLTRPASRDAVARLVAAKLGWLFGALVNDLESGRAATMAALFREVGVATTSTTTDPAEALRLIATHVLRSDNV